MLIIHLPPRYRRYTLLIEALIFVMLTLLMVLTTASAHAQTCTPGGGVTCTANLNLWLPPAHYQNWDIPMNANSNTLDAFSATVVSLTPIGSQSVAQPIGTYFNMQFPMVYGTLSSLRFGVNPNAWDGALTRDNFGNFSLDTTTIGNGSASLAVSVLNAQAGLLISGGAPVGNVPCGNGSLYVACPISSLVTSFYQTVASNGSPLPQRTTLNFSSNFAFTTSTSTNVDLAPTGVAAGTYAPPVSISVDNFGRITAISSGSAISRTCNSNGCYRVEADGTITAWGTVSAPTAGGTLVTVAITFPTSFTNSYALTTTGGGDPDGADDAYVVYHRNDSLGGSTAVVRCSVNIGGSGCTSISQSVPVNWTAVGY